jgi:hypothetical protein
MTKRPPFASRTLCSAAVLTCLLAACGGGDGDPPPANPGSVVEAVTPVVTITNNVPAEVATGAVTFTFSFNRDVGTTFTADDVTVTGGTKGAFTRVSGTSATLLVTPATGSGVIEVAVAAGAVADAGGAANAAVSAQKAYNVAVAPPPVPPLSGTRLVNFEETTAPALIGFGGAEDASVVADPTDAANKVARVVKSGTAETWAGTTVAVCPSDAIARVPFTATETTLMLRVWSPAANVPVRLKLEDAADAGKTVEVDAIATVANAWQVLSFNFANQASGTAALNLATTYNKASVFFNFGVGGAATGARTYYFDDLTFGGTAFSPACAGASGGGGGGGGTPTGSQITMSEGAALTFTGFGGADGTAVADPTDAANTVARVVKSVAAETWAGTTISLLPNQAIAPIGFSAGNTTITARVWSPVAGIPVRMKVESATDVQKTVETEATVTTASGWQTLSFNFANQATGTAALNLATVYDKLSVFFDFGRTGAQVGADRTYYIDDITMPGASGGGGGAVTPLVFSSGYRQGGATGQGGMWGYFSGDFSNYVNTFTGGGFADSAPAVADDAQYFFIAVTTSAPTAPAGVPSTSGGYLGMYVTHPGLTLTGQTQLAINLGMDADFFQKTTNKDFDVRIVGAQEYDNGSGGKCKVTLKSSITPTTAQMVTYTVTLASMTLEQACTGGGFNSGVTTVAQALAQPIGAINSQFSFPNVNTTVTSGNPAVYATGITRGKTEFR